MMGNAEDLYHQPYLKDAKLRELGYTPYDQSLISLLLRESQGPKRLLRWKPVVARLSPITPWFVVGNLGMHPCDSPLRSPILPGLVRSREWGGNASLR